MYHQLDVANSTQRAEHYPSQTADLVEPQDRPKEFLIQKQVDDLSVDDLITALSVTREQANYVELVARSQSFASVWEDARSMWLTASKFGLICGRKAEFGSRPPSATSTILGGYGSAGIAASIRYDRQWKHLLLLIVKEIPTAKGNWVWVFTDVSAPFPRNYTRQIASRRR